VDSAINAGILKRALEVNPKPCVLHPKPYTLNHKPKPLYINSTPPTSHLDLYPYHLSHVTYRLRVKAHTATREGISILNPVRAERQFFFIFLLLRHTQFWQANSLETAPAAPRDGATQERIAFLHVFVEPRNYKPST